MTTTYSCKENLKSSCRDSKPIVYETIYTNAEMPIFDRTKNCKSFSEKYGLSETDILYISKVELTQSEKILSKLEDILEKGKNMNAEDYSAINMSPLGCDALKSALDKYKTNEALNGSCPEPVYCCESSYVDVPVPVLDRSKSKEVNPKLYEETRYVAGVKTTPKDKDEFDLISMLEKLRFNTKTKLVFTIYDRSLVVNNLKLNIEIYDIFAMFLKLFDRPRALKETGRIVKEKLKPLFQKEKNDREITQERI